MTGFSVVCCRDVMTSNPKRRIVVVNIHGGFPSSFVDAALDHLPTFARIRDVATTYTRTYPTSPTAAASLHDLLMDAPPNSMTDACWHDWSRTCFAHRSIFHVLKTQGYETHMSGAYGIEARFDPHRTMRDFPYDLTTALQDVGVDTYDFEDAAFTCRTAHAHDREVLGRAAAKLSAWREDDVAHPRASPSRAFVINLLGCQDVHKCSWMSASKASRVPTIDETSWTSSAPSVSLDEASLATSQYADDPRSGGDHDSLARRALLRMAMLTDHMRGERCEAPGRDKLIRTIHALHTFAWRALVDLDAALQSVVDAVLDDPDSALVLMSDHATSMYEHGMRCEAPWEGCSRGFVMIASGGHSEVISQQASLSLVPHAIMRLAGVPRIDWRLREMTLGRAVTLSTAPSALCRANVEPTTPAFAMPCMWCRTVVQVDARVYAVVHWWSIEDMARATDAAGLTRTPIADEALDAATVARQNTWALPIVDATPSAVYDITTDTTEMDNLCLHEGWLEGDEANLVLEEASKAIVAHADVKRMRIAFPPNADALHPDEVAMCSVQTRPDMVRDGGGGGGGVDVGVQTDHVVRFALDDNDPPTRTSTTPRRLPRIQRQPDVMDVESVADTDAPPSELQAAPQRVESRKAQSIAQMEKNRFQNARNN